MLAEQQSQCRRVNPPGPALLAHSHDPLLRRILSSFMRPCCAQAGQEDDEFEQEAVDSEANRELQAAFPEAAVLLQRVQKGVPNSAPADSLYARCRLYCTSLLTPLQSHFYNPTL